MKILVTGGAGYVGSCICQALILEGHTPVILDGLFSGREYFVQDKIFYKADFSDEGKIAEIFSDHPEIEYVIHCAERAMVDSSVFNPYEYYVSNVVKGIEFYKLLLKYNCRNMVFCSSAGVFDSVAGYKVSEQSPIHPRSPFARSKYIMEMILEDFCAAYDMRCITLRIFNPVGAAPDMSCGLEKSNSGNIISRLISASDSGEAFTINGIDWGTKDGTCIRDYTHVWDVAMAHVKAVENYDTAFQSLGGQKGNGSYLAINIGTGIGSTVKEVICAYQNVSGEAVEVKNGPRRAGDISGAYSDTNLSKNAIGWKAELSMEEAILDAIRWERIKNIQGRQ